MVLSDLYVDRFRKKVTSLPPLRLAHPPLLPVLSEPREGPSQLGTNHAGEGRFLPCSVQRRGALEWNLFPYSESTRQQLIFMYQIGRSWVDWWEETIFEQANEWVIDHRFLLPAQLRRNLRLRLRVQQRCEFTVPAGREGAPLLLLGRGTPKGHPSWLGLQEG